MKSIRDGDDPKNPDLPAFCPICRSTQITTTAKVPDARSYWRCVACGEIWNPSLRDTARGHRRGFGRF
jgi:hypothetical protein